MVVFGGGVVFFAPTFGKYGVAIRMLFAFSFGNFVGVDELWRTLGNGRTDGADVFGSVCRI